MNPSPIVPDEEICYKQIGDVQLHLSAFFPGGARPEKPVAAIVFFFGGGWNQGSREQFYPHCAHFAGRGMVAFSAEYRVRSRHGTTPLECVQDGKSAIRWLRQNAGSLGIDPGRLVAAGGSAGGHVAACAGILQGRDEPLEDTAISSRPDALVLFNPVIDTSPEGYGFETVQQYWRQISPLHQVDDKTPPTILFHGLADTTVPPAGAKQFQAAMHSRGNRCDLFLYEGQGHGFFNFKRDGDFYERTLREADRFVVSLGFLEPALPSSR